MDQVMEKVSEALRRNFPNSTTELEVSPEFEKVTGFLIWNGFEGEEQIDRQRRVSRALHAQLDPAELGKLSAIFTVTPSELAVIRED